MVSPWPAYYAKPDNLRSRPKRAEFWKAILERTRPSRVLEVGCGDGLNLEHIAAPIVVGVDAFPDALALATARMDGKGNLLKMDARDLSHFSDRSFDLAFTCTTLQHISNDEECRTALRELIRVSREWVLVMEYDADQRTPVAWRGDPEGIVKRPWGKMMEEERVQIVGTGFLAHDPDAFDDVTWYLGKR